MFDGVERVSGANDYNGRAMITLGNLQKALDAGGALDSYIAGGSI